jgi:germination protein YpeB
MDNGQFAQMEKLKGYADTLLMELYKMEQDVAQGNVRFGELRQKGRLILKRASDNLADTNFTKVNQNFTDYPTLVYDGPFSENVITGKPQGMSGQKVNLNQAIENAKKFIGSNYPGTFKEVSSGNGSIATYGLELTPTAKNQDYRINIDITKTGGHVLWMLNSRDVLDKPLSNEQASAKAKEFLRAQGFGNLVETYYLSEDNTTTVTFIGVTPQGVLLYPDLMKAKVARDNGEIVGFDAYHYLMAPKNRQIPAPKLTEAQARAKVSPRLTIDRVQLAVIPMPGNKEQLCYEFKGRFGDSNYFVYINAENGNEENILKIINDANGTLTQ